MWTPHQKVQCVLWLMELKSLTRVQRHVRIEWNGMSLLACLIDLSGLLQNESSTRQCLLSRKLKDNCQFEIPKFPSSLKLFLIG
ncbi:hypothetical protein TNCV_186961 [Trichonephila clavipes]|nr:hypothetical protein TNCV_186961 [Trichonephila clavipes]